MIDISNCDQNSAEWLQARLGRPTASMFSAILAKGEGKVRRSYLYKLAGEIITGEPSENYTNAHMERGHVQEPEARRLYAFMKNAEPTQVGFVWNAKAQAGCSPDSLLGEDGLLEVKTKLPALLIDAMLRDDAPPEHKPQCQGALWVCQRDWLDLAIYSPKMPLVVHRIVPDHGYRAQLIGEVARFNDELAATVERVRAYGGGQ